MYALFALLLAGCWSPTTTGPQSMVGAVHDAEGQPIEGLKVDTVEARSVTDAEGRFAVNYKEPSQSLRFQVGEVTFRRAYRPEDDGQDVRIDVPPLAPAMLHCEFEEECSATLTWDLGEGLSASLVARCARDEPVPLRNVPEGTPITSTCRESTTAPDEMAQTIRDEANLHVSPLPVTLTIAFKTTDKTLPTDCTVYVDDVPAVLSSDGFYTAETFGHTEVTGICDGIPAAPRMLYVRDAHHTTLIWRRNTPEFDLVPYTPWVQSIIMVKTKGLNRGWSMELRPGANGRFAIPPLDKGTYAIGANLSEPRVKSMRPGEELSPAILHYREVPGNIRIDPEVEEALGIMLLDAPLGSGNVPVVWHSP